MSQQPWRPGFEMWLWSAEGGKPAARAATPAPPSGPVRIGDSERDDAVAKLGDHFAAGRLSRDELDERIEEAIQAKFNRDLEPLFVDLPATTSTPDLVQPSPSNRSGVPRTTPPPLVWLVPLLMVAIAIGAVALQAPWLLWALVWMSVLSRSWGRGRHQHPQSRHHREHWQQESAQWRYRQR